MRAAMIKNSARATLGTRLLADGRIMLPASPVLAHVHGSQRSQFHGVTASALSGCLPGQAESGAGLVNGRAFAAVGVAVGTGRHALERRQAPPAASPTALPVMSRKPGFFTRRPGFQPPGHPRRAGGNWSVARAVIGL